jgi:hypothetical protein
VNDRCMNCRLHERIQLEQPDKCQRKISFDGEYGPEVLAATRSRSGLPRELALPERAGSRAEPSLRIGAHGREQQYQ